RLSPTPADARVVLSRGGLLLRGGLVGVRGEVGVVGDADTRLHPGSIHRGSGRGRDRRGGAGGAGRAVAAGPRREREHGSRGARWSAGAPPGILPATYAAAAPPARVTDAGAVSAAFRSGIPPARCAPGCVEDKPRPAAPVSGSYPPPSPAPSWPKRSPRAPRI